MRPTKRAASLPRRNSEYPASSWIGVGRSACGFAVKVIIPLRCGDSAAYLDRIPMGTSTRVRVVELASPVIPLSDRVSVTVRGAEPDSCGSPMYTESGWMLTALPALDHRKRPSKKKSGEDAKSKFAA